MLIGQYESKFSELSRFADEYVNIKVRKCKMFKNGLKPGINIRVAPLRILSGILSDMVKKNQN